MTARKVCTFETKKGTMMKQNAFLHFPRSFHEAFSPMLFMDDTIRPTIALLLIRDNGVLLVNPRHAYEANLPSYWIPPQEKIQYTDSNIICAVQRGVREELGFVVPEMCLYNALMLVDMENHMPLTRTRDGIKTKLIRFVGLRIPPTSNVCCNVQENRTHKFVSSLDELDDAMAEVALRRKYKYECTCNAIVKACKLGLLNWEIPEGLLCCSSY